MIRLVPLVLLVACGPVSMASAERQCIAKARLAEAPRGYIAVGVDSDGRARSKGEVTITSDFLLQRDPAQVFERCVVNLTGEIPTRPFYEQPGVRG